MGPLEVMLMACIGAFFGGILKDIVMDFARQDELLALLDDVYEDIYRIEDWIKKFEKHDLST